MKISTSSSWIKGGAAALVLAIAGSIGGYYEGKVNTTYVDIGGVPSICNGHTQGVQLGQVATDDQCMTYLQSDMKEAYGYVNACILAPITVTQAAAFTDAAYNAGKAVVCGSTLQKLANSGHMKEACAQLLRWNKVNGKVVQGLVNRRQAEYDLCIEGLQ